MTPFLLHGENTRRESAVRVEVVPEREADYARAQCGILYYML